MREENQPEKVLSTRCLGALKSWMSMEVDPLKINYLQPALFDLGEASSGELELFPRIWGALEALVDPEAKLRQSGLDCIIELNAARISPLVAYLLTMQLQDPDMNIRGEIIRVLTGVLSSDDLGQLSTEPVRRILLYQLSQMHKDHIYKLLELVEMDPSTESRVVQLFKTCHHSGDYLSEILLDRRENLAIRDQAARLIGQVGYVEAISGIDRLISRLESRVNGQQYLPFYPSENSEEANLLPTLKLTLDFLQAP
jgi:hypothetical protein